MDTPEKQILRIVIENMNRCSVCHRSFEEGDVEVISRQNDVWVMIVQCEDCHARSFVAAQIGDTPFQIEDHLFELASEGLLPVESLSSDSLTTVEPEQVDIVEDPINSDDVEEMQEFLKDFSGDFKTLFSR